MKYMGTYFYYTLSSHHDPISFFTSFFRFVHLQFQLHHLSYISLSNTFSFLPLSPFPKPIHPKIGVEGIPLLNIIENRGQRLQENVLTFQKQWRGHDSQPPTLGIQ